MIAASLHHPGIVVPNLEQAIEFYSNALGYEVHSESSFGPDDDGFNQVVGLSRAAAKFCMLRGRNSYIEIFEYQDAIPKDKQESTASEEGIRHLAFVVENVEHAIELCERCGGSKINDPVSVPGGATAAYCRDPFGNLLEFVVPGGRFPALLPMTTNKVNNNE